MSRIEAARRPGKRLAFHTREDATERLVVEDLLPALRIVGDGLADLMQPVRLGHPDAAAEEHLLRIEMHVESRRMRVASECVPEMHAGIRLVGRLVL